MIKDNIKKAKEYYNLSERVELGLKFLQNENLSALDNGKYEILNNEVFVTIQDYMTKETPVDFEAHKKYIDIQYMIEGEEKIGVEDIENFSPKTNYNEEKDIVFLKRNRTGMGDYVNLKQDEFVILMPSDAHQPSVACNSSSRVKKAVVKVQV